MTIIVGYLGPEGSFSEAVCSELFPANQYSNWEFKRYNNLSEVLDCLLTGVISLAIMPLQNSICGILQDAEGNEFLAKIAESDALKIVAERFLPLDLCLLGTANATLKDINVVHVNPYSREMCRSYLHRHPHWHLEVHDSTSAAAKAVSELADKNHAALASVTAAKTYQLKVLAEKLFHDDEHPIMHFMAVANRSFAELASMLQQPIITSLIIYASDFDAIHQIADICQLKISIVRKLQAEDSYLVDLEGSINALEKFQNIEKIISVKSLGAFPACNRRALYRNRFSVAS